MYDPNDREGVETTCPEGHDAIYTDEGLYCPKCEDEGNN